MQKPSRAKAPKKKRVQFQGMDKSGPPPGVKHGRGPSDAAAKSAEPLPPMRPAPVATSPERIRWNKLTDGLSSIHGRPFIAGRSYSEGDVILHKQHGMGIVEGVCEEPASITILFRNGIEQIDNILDD